MRRADLLALAARVERMTERERHVDWLVWEALGGKVHRITRLGLNGRTPGRRTPVDAEGNTRALPRYTDDHRRHRTAAALRALAEEADDGE